MHISAARFFDEVGTGGDGSGEACKAFQAFRGALRFTWTAERAVEGEHARLHKRGRAAPNHSVRYLSFARRVQELSKHIQADPSVIVRLGELLANHPTALQMVLQLGLERHPCVRELRQDGVRISRHKALFDLVFMGDVHSMFRLDAPRIHVKAECSGYRSMAQQSEHCDGILQACAVEHILSDFSQRSEVVCCMPLLEGSVHRLCDLLCVEGADNGPAINLRDFVPNVLELNLPKSVSRVLFFKPLGKVRGGAFAAAAKRRKIAGEGGLLRTDLSITMHRVVQADMSKRTMALEAAPANQWAAVASQPLLLSLHSVPLESLRKMLRFAPADDESVFFVPGDVLQERLGTLSPRKEDHVRALLQALCDAGEAGCTAHSFRTAALQGEMTEAFEASRIQGLAESKGDRWYLTADGQHLGVMAFRVVSDEAVLQVRPASEVPVADMSMYELLMHLKMCGWEHCFVASASKRRYPGYQLGGPKRFYSKRTDTTVARQYLTALATAETRADCVPPLLYDHFMPERFYECIIKGIPYTRRAQVRRKEEHRVYDEEAWLGETDFVEEKLNAACAPICRTRRPEHVRAALSVKRLQARGRAKMQRMTVGTHRRQTRLRRPPPPPQQRTLPRGQAEARARTDQTWPRWKLPASILQAGQAKARLCLRRWRAQRTQSPCAQCAGTAASG